MDFLFCITVFLFLFTRTHQEIIGFVPEWGDKMIIQSDNMLLSSTRSYQSRTYQAQTVESISGSNDTVATSSDSFSGFGNSLKNVVSHYQEAQYNKISPLQERLETIRRMRDQSLNYLLDLLFGRKTSSTTQGSSSLGMYSSLNGSITSLSGSMLSNQTTRYANYFTYNENETMSFSAQGKVRTSDGRSIDFSMDLTLSRSFTEQTASFIDYTQPVFCDPLVINLDTASANVTDQKFFFDLDSDGEEEEISMMGSGSGYLALDKNGDGIINNGNELFGAKSGNGFSDLAMYDIDKNGWIDEADEIFDKLKIWTMDSDGSQKLLGLKEAGVGTLYLGSSAADFSLKDENNATNAVIRATGMFLYEDGRTGTMQQLDLAT